MIRICEQNVAQDNHQCVTIVLQHSHAQVITISVEERGEENMKKRNMLVYGNILNIIREKVSIKVQCSPFCKYFGSSFWPFCWQKVEQ